jgi:hypothetical protein
MKKKTSERLDRILIGVDVVLIVMTIIVGFLFLATGVVHAQEDENTFMGPIMAGDWWTAITSVYLDIIGGAFWAIMVLLPAAMIYIKTRNTGPPVLILILGSAIFGALPGFDGPTRVLFVIFMGFGIGIGLYRAFTKSSG